MKEWLDIKEPECGIMTQCNKTELGHYATDRLADSFAVPGADYGIGAIPNPQSLWKLS